MSEVGQQATGNGQPIDERLADVPAFEIGGVEFRCTVQGEGGSARYVWRSADRRLAVGSRMLERPEVERVKKGDQIVDVVVHVRARGYWARCDGELIGSYYSSISDAMFYAVAASKRSAAA
jgi:hypothetical protein